MVDQKHLLKAMYGSKSWSERRASILSARAYNGYRKHVEAMAERRATKPYRVVARLVNRHGINGLYWCHYLIVEGDLPEKGFYMAIPLDSKN